MTKAMYFLVAILVGCSTAQQAKRSNLRDPSVAQSPDQRAHLAKSRADKAQEDGDRKMVLAKHSQITSQMGLAPQTMSQAPLPSSLPGKVLEVTPDSVISGSFGKMPEGQLYAEITDRYQAHDVWGFELRSKAYLGRFTDSERRDEVVYMKGLMELGDKNYGVALAQFNRVLRDHPNGKKAPSAMFAKGVTYKRMNLVREAKLALIQVLQKYPGSPESMRAKVELKVIK